MGLLALVLFAVAASGPPAALREETLTLEAPSEVVATVTAGCAGCSWGVSGREAAVLVLELDGRYSQHLVLTRGERPAEYSVFLGALAAGAHRLLVSADRRASARGVGAVAVPAVVFRHYAVGDPGYEAQARAPLVHARRGTLQRFSDLPLLSWYETDVTERGRRLRYSIVFSNEDGGTPVDRLMATWGRTTDIEFVYAVELDEGGRVISETYQAKGHELVPFAGRHAGCHPLLWVVTDNNMVGERGRTKVRFAPAPRPADLAHRSREAVMGDEPWSYRVSSEELRREGKVAQGARAWIGAHSRPAPLRVPRSVRSRGGCDARVCRRSGGEWRARVARFGRGRREVPRLARASQLPERLLPVCGRPAGGRRRHRDQGDTAAGLHAPASEAPGPAAPGNGPRASRERQPALHAGRERGAGEEPPDVDG